MTNLLKKAEEKGLRSLAKDMDQSKKKLKKDLEEKGFTTLRDYENKSSKPVELSLSYSIDQMEKRKLQGLFGEKISSFVEGKIKRFLKDQFSDEWEIRKGIRLKTKGEKQKNAFFGLKPGENQNWKCTGKSIAHRGLDTEDLKQRVKAKHYHTEKELFEKFKQYQIPSIDNIYYALKKKGDTETHEYRAYDHSKKEYDATGIKQEIELQKIEDFKIIGLEVKTSTRKASNLLSSVQREVRDLAENSAFLDFYLCKVNYKINSCEIPDEVPVKIQKLEV